MGTLERLILSDTQWDRISAHIIGNTRTRGSSGRDNRLFVEAVLWIVRTVSRWRDLPDLFGAWNPAFRRFSRRSRKGFWPRHFSESLLQQIGLHAEVGIHPFQTPVLFFNGSSRLSRTGGVHRSPWLMSKASIPP